MVIQHWLFTLKVVIWSLCMQIRITWRDVRLAPHDVHETPPMTTEYIIDGDSCLYMCCVNSKRIIQHMMRVQTKFCKLYHFSSASEALLLIAVNKIPGPFFVPLSQTKCISLFRLLGWGVWQHCLCCVRWPRYANTDTRLNSTMSSSLNILP